MLIGDINHIGPNPPFRNEANTQKFIIAIGGTVTTDGNDKIHKFTLVGLNQFQVLQAGDNPFLKEDLGIGGGAGGGGRGGGGGGGIVHTFGRAIAVGIYNIVIGDGGIGATGTFSPKGTNGGDSSFDGSIAPGGGAGGVTSVVAADRNGSNGGTGGGGATDPTGAIQGTGGIATNGGDGGDACNNVVCGFRGGGGGGSEFPGNSGLAGVNPSRGGDGKGAGIEGFPQNYGGGGGGGGGAGGASGGNGGGGAGTVGGAVPPGDGVDGLGGGGGSSENLGGGSGGSGVWIIRYQYR